MNDHDKLRAVERNEDMSRAGKMKLIRQPDGDVVVALHGPDGGYEVVEFCASGGRSPNTLAALRILFDAMEADNQGATLAALGGKGEDCHCATCTCNPGMTRAIRFDVSNAEREGVIREHLISMGWTPPTQPEARGDNLFESALDYISGNSDYTIEGGLKVFAARKPEAPKPPALEMGEAVARPRGFGLSCTVFATRLQEALTSDKRDATQTGSFGPAVSKFIREVVADTYTAAPKPGEGVTEAMRVLEALDTACQKLASKSGGCHRVSWYGYTYADRVAVVADALTAAQQQEAADGR